MTGAPDRSNGRSVLRGLLFVAGLVLAVLNAVMLFIFATLNSQPAHSVTGPATGSGAAPFYVALAVLVVLAVVSVVAWFRGRRTLAATLAAVQFIPILLILLWIASQTL
ncbi:hypothetical protein [Brevundimonas lenta]|uniref:Fatty acid desaturase n=1 Tax=Brevundimonas lenta TaxID=424796 RepID=A0A7W6NQ90_9CAUL|nr:hypothetical protein [Brevundimonas lenta]MBB4082952.1 fatty acid desaturase [Brevundimonas lenta]